MSARIPWKGYGERDFFLWQYLIKKSKEKKVLGIIIDSKLKFSDHINNLCKRAFEKIFISSRLTNDLNDSQKS